MPGSYLYYKTKKKEFIYRGSFSSKKGINKCIINSMEYMAITTSQYVGVCFVLFSFLFLSVLFLKEDHIVAPCMRYFQYSVKTVILYNLHQINTFRVFFN